MTMKKETVFNKTVLLLMALLLSLSPTLHSQEEEDISYVFRGYYAARYAFSFSSDFFAGEHTVGASYEFHPRLSIGIVGGIVVFNSPRSVPILTTPKAHPELPDAGNGFTIGFAFRTHTKSIIKGGYTAIIPRYTKLDEFQLFDLHIRLGVRVPVYAGFYLDGSAGGAYRPINQPYLMPWDDPHPRWRGSIEIGLGYGL
jgi:hypothetical protein